MLEFSVTLHIIPLPQCYQFAEMEKKLAYEQRIREVKFGSISPLRFSTTGPGATVVIKSLASMIADKQEQPYSKTFWRLCKHSFSLLRSPVICLCGSCSSIWRNGPYIGGHHAFIFKLNFKHIYNLL